MNRALSLDTEGRTCVADSQHPLRFHMHLPDPESQELHFPDSLASKVLAANEIQPMRRSQRRRGAAWNSFGSCWVLQVWQLPASNCPPSAQGVGVRGWGWEAMGAASQSDPRRQAQPSLNSAEPVANPCLLSELIMQLSECRF